MYVIDEDGKPIRGAVCCPGAYPGHYEMFLMTGAWSREYFTDKRGMAAPRPNGAQKILIGLPGSGYSNQIFEVSDLPTNAIRIVVLQKH